jgi:HEAT repeat protein
VRRGRWLLALLVLLSGLGARAQEAETLDLDRVKELVAAGELGFNISGNTELSPTERNRHRKEAYKSLTEAFDILDAWCETHPADIDRLEKIFVRIQQMRYWIRKESPLGLHDDENETPSPVQPAKQPLRETSPAPESAKSPSVSEKVPSSLDTAREHDRARAHDPAGAIEKWLKVLESLEDPGSPEYAEALGRVAELSAQLKDAYRKLRKRDPDAIPENRRPRRTAAIAAALVPMLKSSDPDARCKAARQLAALGDTTAAYEIQKALRREKDATVRSRFILALVRLGGGRTCEALARFARERHPDLPLSAVKALLALSRKGPVQARLACLSLGTFVARSKLDEVGRAALDALRRGGVAAVPGLVVALETKDRDREIVIMTALGEAGHREGAPPLCERLLVKGDAEVREAAMAALLKIGRPSVPALIEALRNRRTRRYAAVALYEITGETFGENGKAWRTWWKKQ